jgi:hypothetical protein
VDALAAVEPKKHTSRARNLAKLLEVGAGDVDGERWPNAKASTLGARVEAVKGSAPKAQRPIAYLWGPVVPDACRGIHPVEARRAVGGRKLDAPQEERASTVSLPRS